MKLGRIIIIISVTLVMTYFFTSAIDIPNNHSDSITADTSEENITDLQEEETAAPIRSEETKNIPRPAIESFYDLTAENLDLNNMNFEGVLRVESKEEWYNYVNDCISRGFHYVLFSTPSEVEYDVKPIMDRNSVTGVVITTMRRGDTTVTAYKFTYSLSTEILRKLDKAGADALDEKQSAVYAKAQEFVNSVSYMSDYEKTLAIHNYVCENLTYLRSSDSEDTTSCYAGLILGSGNCQAYTDSFDLLCGLAGIKSGRMTGTASDEEHSWNYVVLDGKLYFTDCTFDDGISDEERGYGLFYFNLPYSVISQTHTEKFIPDGYALAGSLDNNNFYVRNNSYAGSPYELEQIYNALADNNSSGEILFNTAKGYSKINTSKFSFVNYEVIKFKLS